MASRRIATGEDQPLYLANPTRHPGGPADAHHPTFMIRQLWYKPSMDAVLLLQPPIAGTAIRCCL